MSLYAQIAFGKNYTLQRQLEDKFLNLRRIFKSSRRRLDSMEEECVAALYKLLMFAQEKQALNENGESDVLNDLYKRSKSQGFRRSQSSFGMADDKSRVSKRPATAMTAKTYKQSYSFVKDGLNIDKSRKDRYIRDKTEKEKQIENNVKIERLKDKLKDDWGNFDERPFTAFDRRRNSKDDGEEANEELPVRPKTACPLQNTRNRPLSRPKTDNTLMLPQKAAAQRSSTPLKVSECRTPSPFRKSEEEIPASARDRIESPCLKTVHESRTALDGTRSPLVVRITTTRLNDVDDADEKVSNAFHRKEESPLRAESRLDNDVEDELVPLTDDDKNVLRKATSTDNHDKFKRHASPYRPATAGANSPSRNGSRQNSTLDGSILKKSAEKTQTFLSQYSRKSKIFGYVIKTRTSIVAPREKVVTQRSPCITYQELCSIKAGIKQHESKTRSLLQRSAKISSYVDKLANAGVIRDRIQKMNNS